MKVLIMAAGLGQRFRTEGFEIPKPLIRYQGQPIIEHSINQFNGIPRKDIIVVGIPEVCFYMKGAHPEIRTVCVENTQNGPGMSALLAGGLIGDDESVVLVDCDVIIGGGAAQAFCLDFAGNAYIGGALMFTTVDGDSSPYCSVHLEPHPKRQTIQLPCEVRLLQEKTGTSQKIAIGLYAFKKWRVFRRSVMEWALDDSGKEVYISKVLQHVMTEQGQEIRATGIPLSLWTCLGTPRELAEAIQ